MRWSSYKRHCLAHGANSRAAGRSLGDLEALAKHGTLKRRPLKEKGAKANFEDTRAPNMKNCTQKNIQWFLTKLILWRFCPFPSCFTVSQRVSLTMPVETHTSIAGPKIRLSRVPPKSLILIGFSVMSHPFWGTPIFGNTHIYVYLYWVVPPPSNSHK